VRSLSLASNTNLQSLNIVGCKIREKGLAFFLDNHTLKDIKVVQNEIFFKLVFVTKFK